MGDGLYALFLENIIFFYHKEFLFLFFVLLIGFIKQNTFGIMPKRKLSAGLGKNDPVKKPKGLLCEHDGRTQLCFALIDECHVCDTEQLPKAMEVKPKNHCEHDGCTTSPAFNTKGETKGRFCGPHRLEGMVNVKSKRCEQIECTKQPVFNTKGEAKGRFCADHKQSDMVDVKSKQCEQDGCTTRPYFNTKGESKGRFCADHKQDGMVDVKNKKCEHDGCTKHPIFNTKGESKTRFCADHKQDGMVDVKSKKCEQIGCTTVPTFNTKGESKARFCADHKEPNMVDVIHKMCEQDGCTTRPLYNTKGKSKGRFCVDHKQDGMVDVKSKQCEQIGCTTTPYFNTEGESKGRFCADHKELNMVDVVSKKCEQNGCTKHPYFNTERESKGRFCADHKQEDMVDVKNKKCEQDGCTKQPHFNVEGESKGRFCVAHKQDGMIDVTATYCIGPGYPCDTIVNKSSPYDGYCLRCFVYLFPDKPIARNHKNKELAVKDFIESNFPDFTWISDKRIQGGCSRRRPDMFLDMGFQVLMIEVDEHQHTDYNCSSENERKMDLSKDIGGRRMVIIRFNPDEYFCLATQQKIKSCWTRHGTTGLVHVSRNNQTKWMHRLECLREQVDYWTQEAHVTDKTVEEVHLFYG
jgi:hypothetical protein